MTRTQNNPDPRYLLALLIAAAILLVVALTGCDPVPAIECADVVACDTVAATATQTAMQRCTDWCGNVTFTPIDTLLHD